MKCALYQLLSKDTKISAQKYIKTWKKEKLHRKLGVKTCQNLRFTTQARSCQC